MGLEKHRIMARRCYHCGAIELTTSEGIQYHAANCPERYRGIQFKPLRVAEKKELDKIKMIA